jgi:hypothetical protein
MGREKFLKCDFFISVNIKNHKKWESEKTKLEKGKKIRHIIYAVKLYLIINKNIFL